MKTLTIIKLNSEAQEKEKSKNSRSKREHDKVEKVPKSKRAKMSSNPKHLASSDLAFKILNLKKELTQARI